jgi:hypothetical protein
LIKQSKQTQQAKRQANYQQALPLASDTKKSKANPARQSPARKNKKAPKGLVFEFLSHFFSDQQKLCTFNKG